MHMEKFDQLNRMYTAAQTVTNLASSTGYKK